MKTFLSEKIDKYGAITTVLTAMVLLFFLSAFIITALSNYSLAVKTDIAEVSFSPVEVK